jgi:hypothetical protein
MQIKLVIGSQKISQPEGVLEQVREILGPQNDRMDGFGRQIDRMGADPRSRDQGPALA